MVRGVTLVTPGTKNITGATFFFIGCTGVPNMSGNSHALLPVFCSTQH